MSMFHRIVALLYGLGLFSLLLMLWRNNRLMRKKAVILAMVGFYVFCWMIPAIHESHWPFLRWGLFANAWDADWELSETRVVTSDGKERPIDDRLYDPFHPVTFERYMSRKTFLMPDDKKREVAEHFLTLFNKNLKLMDNHTLLGKQALGITSKKPLGMLAFPPHDNGYRRWDPIPQGVTITGIKIYKATWNVYKRHKNPNAVKRELVYEYRHRG